MALPVAGRPAGGLRLDDGQGAERGLLGGQLERLDRAAVGADAADARLALVAVCGYFSW